MECSPKRALFLKTSVPKNDIGIRNWQRPGCPGPKPREASRRFAGLSFLWDRSEHHGAAQPASTLVSGWCRGVDLDGGGAVPPQLSPARLLCRILRESSASTTARI